LYKVEKYICLQQVRKLDSHSDKFIPIPYSGDWYDLPIMYEKNGLPNLIMGLCCGEYFIWHMGNAFRFGLSMMITDQVNYNEKYDPQR
jgi:hypothetical protein